MSKERDIKELRDAIKVIEEGGVLLDLKIRSKSGSTMRFWKKRAPKPKEDA